MPANYCYKSARHVLKIQSNKLGRNEKHIKKSPNGSLASPYNNMFYDRMDTGLQFQMCAQAVFSK